MTTHEQAGVPGTPDRTASTAGVRIPRVASEEGNGTGQPDPERPGRTRQQILGLQSAFSRLVAIGGIIGIGTGIAAIMGSQDVEAWIIGIVVSGVSVILAAIAWSSRIG